MLVWRVGTAQQRWFFYHSALITDVKFATWSCGFVLMSIPSFYSTVSINHHKCYFLVTDGTTAVYNEDHRSVAAQLCDEIDNCNKWSRMTVEDGMQLWTDECVALRLDMMIMMMAFISVTASLTKITTWIMFRIWSIITNHS